MCGITGMTGPGACDQTVSRMMDAQRHRGPDGDGIWVAPGVALGHLRLSIIDLSDAGRQPMTTEDGRYTIIWNGELYNFEEIRRDLSQYRFRSKSDTEVVLYAFAEWGPDCLQRFVGMYAFAIWDARERTLFCGRDRLGIKPFYYARLGDAFLFSSEIRAFRSAGVAVDVNTSILYDFLARDFYEHSDETFFSGIRKLPPAHWMAVRDGKPGPCVQYWELGEASLALEEETSRQSAIEREERLIELAQEAVRSHLVSDRAVAIALSGGLDSATLLSLLDRSHPDPSRVEAFSFAFAEEAYSEWTFVEEMARHTGRRAHRVEMSARQFADTAETISFSQEEPFAGAPISAYSLCYEALRRAGFIVVMDGSGIDEALAGYGRFHPAHWADLAAAGDTPGLEREWAAGGINSPEKRAAACTQMDAASGPISDIGVGQDLTSSVRPDCLHPDLIAQATMPPRFDRPFPDHLRNLMYRELRYTKLPRALRFRDRLSMAVGTELRPPFLDHRLLEYAFALPAEDRICNGVTKAILRRAAEKMLPDAVRMASKRSVQTPQREWFRAELKDWVRDRIDTPSFWSRGWVDRKPALAAMDAYFRGEGDNSFFLWQWINLEMWAVQTLEPSRRAA